MASDTDLTASHCPNATVRGSSVRMPSGQMMSRGQALLAGLSVGSKHNTV